MNWMHKLKNGTIYYDPLPPPQTDYEQVPSEYLESDFWIRSADRNTTDWWMA